MSVVTGVTIACIRTKRYKSTTRGRVGGLALRIFIGILHPLTVRTGIETCAIRHGAVLDNTVLDQKGKRMRTVMILAAAGLSVSLNAGASGQVDIAPPQGMTSDQIGYIYYNMTTGEMIRTGPGTVRGLGDPVWVNEANDQCGCGEWFFQPLRDSATGEDTGWMDWGDIQPNSVIDTMTLLYATSVFDANEQGAEDFGYNISFFDGVDTDQIKGGLDPYIVYLIRNIPGSASGIAAWLITIDLAGGGEFEIGDTDGIDDSGNGNNSGGLGADVDGDGLADFAYGYKFKHPSDITSGVSGPALAGPDPRATGDVDLAALFLNGNWNDFDSFFNFGGQDCSLGCGFQWVPWASAWIGLYANTTVCCPFDLQCDGILDFFDVQIYLQWFADEDPRADMNADGVLDCFDVQIYLGGFSAGCP